MGIKAYGKSWFREDSLISRFSESMGQGIDRRNHEIALDAARVDAELASKAKSEFIANMSHELRTPLNAIIGFSEMLAGKTKVDPAKVAQYGGYIQEAAHHLLAIINSILDVSKIQAGKLEVHAEPIELEEVLSSCLILTEAKAKEKSLTIEKIINGDVPLLAADPLRLKQILINLLSNAVKFTPERGRIEVSASLLKNGFVEISVTDTGLGMTPEEVAIALKPFGQVDTGINRANDGTGLGLPIAHALARLHGGDLLVKSEKEKGTRVSVLIPSTAYAKARGLNQFRTH